MKNKLIVVTLALAAGLAAYFFWKPTGPSPLGTSIGVIAPMTGEGASYGQAMKRGFDLAFKGSAFRLIYEDTRMDAKTAVTATTKLINSDHVSVILGEAASGVTMAVAPVAESNKVVLFSSISSTDKLRTAGDFIFRNVPRNEVQGKTAAGFIFTTLGLKKIAIVPDNDEYGSNLSKSFKLRLAELGGVLVAEEAYQKNTKDFRGIVEKVKSAGAEAIFNPGNYEDTALLLKQLREGGLTIPLVGGDGSYSPELIKQAGAAAEGAYCTVMAADKSTPFYRHFVKQFNLEYQKEPDVYDAYAFEAATFIRAALEAKGASATEVRDYLYATSFDSLTGPLKFDTDGEVSREYGIVQVRNGVFEDFAPKK